MDTVSFLLQYIDLVILGICLCVGFAMKQAFTWLDNRYIPLFMLILGTTIAVVTHLDNINTTVILSGMVSGLSSTGLYEMLRNILNRK